MNTKQNEWLEKLTDEVLIGKYKLAFEESRSEPKLKFSDRYDLVVFLSPLFLVTAVGFSIYPQEDAGLSRLYSMGIAALSAFFTYLLYRRIMGQLSSIKTAKNLTIDIRDELDRRDYETGDDHSNVWKRSNTD